MRRKAGLAVGAAVALVLAGATGIAAWQYADGDEGRPVGTWQEAPGVARTPVAAEEPGKAEPGAAGPVKVEVKGEASAASPEASADPTQADRTEKGQVADGAEAAGRPVATGTKSDDGRQRVGEVLRVDRLLGYLGRGPQKESFSYPGASYVKVHFNRMAMVPGDYLTVSNADGTESYRYDAPKLVTDKWAMSVTGDTAVVEMHRAVSPVGVGTMLGTLGVGVDRVARGFSHTEQERHPESQLLSPERTGREESVCGADTSSDAVCYRSADPIAYTKSKAVARLLINGTELCTSWRVGPNNRMLTNNHCFTTASQAHDTEVWFNYQCATCGGYDVFQPTKVWGAKVLSTDHAYDYTLFTVDNFNAIKRFGYLSLDTARPAKNQELYVPQHPAGQPTKIAGSLGEKAGNCSVSDNAYTGYAAGSDVSYLCDTEGGSSGSPVLSRKTNKVVALHHFGGCPNSGVRGDLLAAKLRTLL